MDREITNLRNQAIAEINEVTSLSLLEQARARYLGKNGTLTLMFKKITDTPTSERKQLGILINQTKETLTAAIGDKKASLLAGKTEVDGSFPGIKPDLGHLHLITQTIHEIEDIFAQIGFIRARYSEVEWDWYAFEALGFGPDHPARDEWETFVIDEPSHPKLGPMILTPHTSNGQVRHMQETKPPIRMINIGKTYRRQSDVSHTPMFHQFEGLVIDRAINLTHLRGTLEYFAQQFYKEERKTRIRPYNFPFTEPSFEVDVTCSICRGRGCKSCGAGWIEIGGAGMVHPAVLKNGGINPDHYSGFAFGWGVERVAMVKVGLDDLRQIYSTDLRYLTQF